MRDLNAYSGNEPKSVTCAAITRNERGERRVRCRPKNDPVITYIWIQGCSTTSLYFQKETRGTILITYLSTNMQKCGYTLQAYPNVEFRSRHLPVACKFKTTVYKKDTLDATILNTSEVPKHQVNMQNRVINEYNLKETANSKRETSVQTANEVIASQTREERNELVTVEILETISKHPQCQGKESVTKIKHGN